MNNSLFMYILLAILIVCAISVTFSKNLLNSVLIFMAYSLVMSIVWVIIESPDLAITEAAVGAGVTSILFFVTLKKIHGVLNNPEEEGESVEDDIENMESSEEKEDIT
ncbi:MAG: DUF4040 domain-containing protein [Lachnospiraceae bacterium]|nr:DUF4040 domain-containing protein [Lachnospiraceae bacterium]